MLPDLEVVKILRKRSGLTQKQLSNALGISQSYLNKIENELAEPPYNTAKKIIEHLENIISEDKTSPKKLMTKIRTISSKKKIKEAVQLMSELSVSQLPVVKEGLIIGSFTKKTIPRLIKKGVKNIENQELEDVMDAPFPMIPDNSKMQLITLLLEFNEAVLLLNKGKFAGIITRHDLLKLI